MRRRIATFCSLVRVEFFRTLFHILFAYCVRSHGCDPAGRDRTLEDRLLVLDSEHRREVPVQDAGHVSSVLRSRLSFVRGTILLLFFFFVLFCYVYEQLTLGALASHAVHFSSPRTLSRARVRQRLREKIKKDTKPRKRK